MSIVRWDRTYATWLTNFKKPMYLVIYEHMKSHVEKDLIGMAEFLHINYSTKDMCCTLVNQQGSFSRDKGNITIESVYTSSMIERIEKHTSRVLSLIQKRFPKYSKLAYSSLKIKK